MFTEYTHVEKWGTDEVTNIELGEVFIFPKLDGTNASAWIETTDYPGECGGAFHAVYGGSRHRKLTLDNDNAGFLNWLLSQSHIEKFLTKYPHLTLFGEWMVPHTLKTYREDVWRRFWVFDVYNRISNQYLSYMDYKQLLDDHSIDYIPPLGIIKNGSYEQFIHSLEQNTFFVQDGKGLGEGIVLKNYQFYNRFGRQCYAKIVRSEFKEALHRTMGCPERDSQLVEETIAKEFINEALCTKTLAKITTESGWSSSKIPELLGRVWFDFIKEDTTEVLKRYKDPSINFRTLKHFVIKEIKVKLPSVF